MGKTTWEGWLEPDEYTPQPVSILTGANLRKKQTENEPDPVEAPPTEDTGK